MSKFSDNKLRRNLKRTSWALGAAFAACLVVKANDEKLLHAAIDQESLRGIDLSINVLGADFHSGHLSKAVDTHNKDLIKAILEEYSPHSVHSVFVNLMSGHYDESVNIHDDPHLKNLLLMTLSYASAEEKQEILNSSLNFGLSQENPDTVRFLLDLGAEPEGRAFASAASLYKGWGPFAKKKPEIAALMVDALLEQGFEPDDGSIEWLQEQLDNADTDIKVEGYGRTLDILKSRVELFYSSAPAMDGPQ